MILRGFLALWLLLIVAALIERVRDKRRRVCPECASRDLEMTGGWFGDVKHRRISESVQTYRCRGCGAELLQANGRRIVAKDVWEAGGGRNEIPTAKLR